MLNFFEEITLQTKKEIPDTPKNNEKVKDMLGQPSGKFDYKVFYSNPSSCDIPIELLIPGGWGDEFDDAKPVNEEEKKAENIEQPQKKIEEEIMPSDSVELLNTKETCMIEVWKDGKKDRTIRVIDIWYKSDEENVGGYNMWTDDSEVNQVNRSCKGYKPIEKKVERAVEKEEVVREEDSDEPEDELILEQLKKAKASVSV